MRTAILIPVAVLLAAAGLAFAIVVAVPLAQDVVGSAVVRAYPDRTVMPAATASR